MSSPSHSLNSHPVAQHYGKPGLLQAIEAGFINVGKDPTAISVEDLAPVDQFHLGGNKSTLQVAALAAVQPSENVLDVGGGIGGPARYLASSTGCHVTVVDLTEEFIRTGRTLTERVGLSDKVSFVHGNALAMPFPDGSFDLAWTQHATMNIADKNGLYREIFRVLKPGGRFVMHDILAGTGEPLYFPVPWAKTPDISFVFTETVIRSEIEGAGFTPVTWNDESDSGIEWMEERMAAIKTMVARNEPLPPNMTTLLGPQAPTMFANVLRAMREKRLRVIQAIFRKP